MRGRGRRGAGPGRCDRPRLAQSDWWNPAALGAALLFSALAVLPSLLQTICTGVLLPHSPERFRTGFSLVHGLASFVSLPAGLAAAALLATALFHEGVIRSRRAGLRLAAMLCLFLLVVLDNALLQPAAARILASTGTSATDGTALLGQLDAISPWLNLACGLAFGVGLLTWLAHRAPRVGSASVTSLGIEERHRRTLFLVGTASFFFGYDTMIATLALPYIGRDLGADESALGFALAIVRLGALGSVLAGRFADRYGRRRLLIASVLAYTVATAATAFSLGLVDFALYQLVASIFLTTEIVLAQVVISEEFPDSARAHGQALLGVFTSLGAGMATVLFPVFLQSDLGWRGMYLVGLLPLLLVAALRRGMQESRRWQRMRARAAETRLSELLQPQFRRRLVCFTLLTSSGAAALVAAFAFTSHHATTRLGWTPSEVSLLIMTAGLAGLAGNFVVGRISDRIGRRIVGFGGLVGSSLAIVLFYQTPWVGPAFALLTFSDTAASVAGNAILTESFPTRLRATAKAWGTTCGVVGGLLGLGLVGLLADRLGGAYMVISGLALAGLAVAPVYFLLAETLRSNLEIMDAREEVAGAV